MRYWVLALLAVVGLWYFLQAPDKTVIVEAPKATPQQQFQALLSGEVVDAAKLAALCSAYPELAIRFLHGKQIKIRGTVAEVRTSGMEGRRADVVLGGNSPRQIVLVCDLDQYSRPGINFRYLGKFEAVGTELLYLVQRERTLQKKAVVTEGTEITEFGALKSMGASLVEFEIVNGPAWAGAETNDHQ